MHRCNQSEPHPHSPRLEGQRPRRIHDRVERPRRGSPPAGAGGAWCSRPSAGDLSRRRFLQTTAIGTAGLMVGPRLLGARPARAMEMSRVVRVEHENATSGWTIVNQEPVDEMVHTAVRALTGIPDTAAAWKSLFPGITPEKKVGIKINLACGDVPTHPEVINAVVDGLLMMDLNGETLPPEHIIVHDLDTAFLCPQTGYTVNWGGPGVQYVGTDHPSIGFDYSQVFTVQHGSGTSDHHVSRIISEFCDYLINAAVIKDHDDWAGVTLCMKNHYGSFDNIAIYPMHYAGFDTGLPGINTILRDELGDKTKLFLIDGTFGLYDGGPGYTPPYHTPPNWRYNSVLMSRDIVALDRIGTEKINEERAAHSLPALDPGHVRAAALPPYNLGTDDLEQIELIEIPLNTQEVAPGAQRAAPVALLAPYPNPAPGRCTLRFHSRAAVDAELTVTDVSGRLIRRVASGRYGTGMHRIAWDGRDDRGLAVAGGTYFARLRAGGEEERKAVVLLR